MRARRDFLRQVLPIGAVTVAALKTDWLERVVSAGAAAADRPASEIAADEGYWREIQQAFCDTDGLMCGFCTPGFVVATVAVLEKYPNATRAQISKGLDGNICRCGTFVRIMEAAMKARSPQSAIRNPQWEGVARG